MISELIGRFHPLVVHFPIGFLYLAFLFELISLFGRWRKLRRAVFPALLMGMVAALIAIITGFNFADSNEADSALLFRHKLFGISTLIVAGFLSVVILIGRKFSKPVRVQSRLFLFIVTISSLTLAGHFGGELAHGEDFWQSSVAVDGNDKANADTRYIRRVRPILESKCYSCHGNVRQKGGLRLDSEAAIAKGGKHGAVVGGEQELLKRITLDPAEKKHMPPIEKTQLTDAEIQVLTDWVNAGASFTERDSEEIEGSGDISQQVVSWFPEEEPNGEPDQDIISVMRLSGVRVVQLAAGSNWLEVTVLPGIRLDNAFWKNWDELAPFVATARFSRCEITDAQLKLMSKAINLRRLFLDQTSVGDAGLSALQGLNQLAYLNLVSTRITGKGIRDLEQLPGLRDLYIFGCKVKPEDLTGLAAKKVRVDTGKVNIPFLPTDTIEFTKK